MKCQDGTVQLALLAAGSLAARRRESSDGVWAAWESSQGPYRRGLSKCQSRCVAHLWPLPPTPHAARRHEHVPTAALTEYRPLLRHIFT